jgi:cellulose synthase/poly-beta-1,6-N-acetylglucosamine synthase-like glycosyltransferase
MPSTVVLMPAHDEAAVIGRTLADLAQRMQPLPRVLVVADNCSDETAKIARAAGVEVIERQDPTRRGKGYALDFGVQHLKAAPPDVVVVLDADCQVAPGTIESIARQSAASGRPVQAPYLMHASENGGTAQEIAAFAFLVRAFARALGLSRLAGVASLSGTGMAFPWRIIASAPLASSHIVEDLALSAHLAAVGTPAQLCPDALVSSRFPGSEKSASTQSRRWQHGHMQVLASAAPGLIWQGLRNGSWPTLAYGLDLLIPPLMLYLALLIGAWLVAALAAVMGLGTLPIALLTAIGLLLSIALAATWWQYGRQVLRPTSLANLPRYALSRIGLHAQRREKSWVRTDRE